MGRSVGYRFAALALLGSVALTGIGCIAGAQDESQGDEEASSEDVSTSEENLITGCGHAYAGQNHYAEVTCGFTYLMSCPYPGSCGPKEGMGQGRWVRFANSCPNNGHYFVQADNGTYGWVNQWCLGNEIIIG